MNNAMPVQAHGAGQRRPTASPSLAPAFSYAFQPDADEIVAGFELERGAGWFLAKLCERLEKFTLDKNARSSEHQKHPWRAAKRLSPNAFITSQFVATLVLQLLVPGIALAGPEPHLPVLSTVSGIRRLDAEQAAFGRPVKLHGIVTVVPGWKNSFFFS